MWVGFKAEQPMGVKCDFFNFMFGLCCFSIIILACNFCQTAKVIPALTLKELQKETPKDGPKGLGEGEYLSAADWIRRTRAGGSAKKPAPQLNYDEQDTLLLQPEQEEAALLPAAG